MLGCNLTIGQKFSATERISGFAVRGENVFFIYDVEIYNLTVSNVAVTGSFRDWSQEMDDENWKLKQLGDNKDLWVLEIMNEEFKTISPQSAFKFRINEGIWVEPPSNAVNLKGGNLIFMQDFMVPKLKAEIIDNHSIWVKLEGVERSLNPKDYRLTTWEGIEIPISAILPNTETEFLVHVEKPFDKRRVHYFEMFKSNIKVACSFDGWFRHLYSSKKLGAEISGDQKSTSFRIFGPRAESLKLFLYKHHDDSTAFQQVEMVVDENGVWEYIFAQNLEGTYYDFTVHYPVEPGSHSFESTGGHISDPYARVNMDAWGKSRVARKTEPAKPLKNGIPKMKDLIAYEVHVQDFTDQLPVSNELKGTIPAMVKKGLRNEKGELIGFDYLVDLGINAVHLLPVQEFLHFQDDLWQASFLNDPYMIQNGINKENYQWGYRTTHAFAVESKYRQKDTEPGAERIQFRDLVQAFHDKEIAVIIDIVPNHTGENMDGSHFNFHFNALDMGYYYRTKNFKHIGAFGNEVKTENRPMVQRWLIDQCKHFVEEFGVDGFRIDLAGQIDKQTLIALRKALGNDIIIYGEPWIASNDPDFESNPSWDWYKEDAPITFFQDDTRNAFKGSVFDIKSKTNDRGWPGGKYNERENVMKGLSAGFYTDRTPLSGINYLDIHDNMALADQFGTNDFDGRFGVDENQFKMAALLLHTSLGPIVIHGGTEFMRSKASAPINEVIKKMVNGQELAFHGKSDTYNQRLANNFIWNNVGRTTNEEGVYCDYKGMHDFWRGLIKFRSSEYGKVFRLSEQPSPFYFEWLVPEDEKALGYLVDRKVLVLINTAEYEFIYYVNGTENGRWKLIGNNEAFDHVNGVKDVPETESMSGNNLTIKLPPYGIRVWIKE